MGSPPSLGAECAFFGVRVGALDDGAVQFGDLASGLFDGHLREASEGDALGPALDASI